MPQRAASWRTYTSMILGTLGIMNMGAPVMWVDFALALILFLWDLSREDPQD